MVARVGRPGRLGSGTGQARPLRRLSRRSSARRSPQPVDRRGDPCGRPCWKARSPWQRDGTTPAERLARARKGAHSPSGPSPPTRDSTPCDGTLCRRCVADSRARPLQRVGVVDVVGVVRQTGCDTLANHVVVVAELHADARWLAARRAAGRDPDNASRQG